MTPHRWRQVEAVFHAAAELDSGQRQPFLLRACAGDDELRHEVESLLRLNPGAQRFLETPALDVELDAFDEQDGATDDADERVGRCVGHYRLVQRIACGGMGAVYRAVRADDAYDAEVAVKLIRPDRVSPGMLRRFSRERQTLAALTHPFITRLLDGGRTDDGVPYLVMEFVDGLPIDRYCCDRGLTLPARLSLFLDVCAAVQFAHRNLVVHRDLKPGNILVTDDGSPKLLDFGIAQILSEPDAPEPSTQTSTGRRPLTPQYASPEQWNDGPITTATDVYSLGVVLYELLTGQSPGRLAAPRDEARRAVRESEPPRPSTVVRRAADRSPRPETDSCPLPGVSPAPVEPPERLFRLLRGDLDTIVLKALQQDPARRYPSVERFADDLRRYLDGRPVLARPDTLAYRTAKLVRRNKLVVGAGAAVLVALVGGLLVAAFGWAHARREQSIAESERSTALIARAEAQDVTVFLQDLLAAANPYELGGNARVTDLLRSANDRIKRELAHQPAVAAQVHFAVAEVYARIWAWREVMPHARRALELNRSLYGSDDARTADCLVLLGRALTFALDSESITLQREALSVRRRLYGDDHPAVAEAQACLGFALWHGTVPPRLEEAETLYRAGLDIYRRQPAPTPRTTADHARVAFSLAVMITGQRRYDEAEALHREALALYRTRRDGPDRYMMECMTRYAVLCHLRGDAAQAETLLAEAIRRTPQGIGELHRCNALWILAAVQQERGQFALAEATFRRALAGECRMLREGDPTGTRRLEYLQQVLDGQGTVPEAEIRETFARLQIAARRGEPLGVGAAALVFERQSPEAPSAPAPTGAPRTRIRGVDALLREAERRFADCRERARATDDDAREAGEADS